ncbi:hypothetical protein VCRA2119O147_1100003 [Vibrio crassostreae]|nr:hypothetical protein VCRA2113O222_110138 [Vibrio crassostreae]CAK1721442.1 hypothetical protein VCRA2112E186_110136 [Vibrio crassostreae]CAK1722109.1 hypothetical protein VCRA2119O245_110139 [Vibrio crassostreae]CAK1725517.1 hypothetical protein VCRA2113O351_110151 [Vibrio crassostreae]CAK1728312.1 hypothetical protein VCRA2118O239_110168 [Vibrio crassostreae]
MGGDGFVVRINLKKFGLILSLIDMVVFPYVTQIAASSKAER